MRAAQGALQSIITPATTSFKGHARQPIMPTLAKRSETKFPSELHRTSHSHGGLHIARFRLLLGGQVTLGGKTGITTLAPVGFEPATSRTAAERSNHSTTDATNQHKIINIKE